MLQASLSVADAPLPTLQLLYRGTFASPARARLAPRPLVAHNPCCSSRAGNQSLEVNMPRYVSLYDPAVPMIVFTNCVNHKDAHAVVYDKQLRGYCVRCEVRDDKE